MRQFFKTATLLVATLAFGFGMQSCDSTKPITQSQLEGHWLLQTIDGQQVKDIHTGMTPTIEFNFADTLVAGSTGCNRYFGKFTLNEKNEFKAGNLGTTMMACPDMKIEDQFNKTLSADGLVMKLNEAKDELSFNQGEKAVLVFKKGEKEVITKKDITLENLTGDWTLSKIAEGDINELFGDNVPTMALDAEGKAHGKSGCNTFNSRISIENDVITFTMPMSTMMACPHLDGEAKFTSYLQGDLMAIYVGDKLSLSKDGILVLEFTKNK